jgi:hypothetical protein
MRKIINSNSIKDMKFSTKDLDNYVSVYDDHIGNVKGKATCGGPIETRIILMIYIKNISMSSLL